MLKFIVFLLLLSGVALAPPVLSQETTQPNFALVLGGGGARGAAHIGVLKVLKENNIKPDLIVGNSMGAIVGALYAAGVPIADIEQMFLSGKMRKAFRPHSLALIMTGKSLTMPLKICKIRNTYPGLFNGKSIEKYLDSVLPDTKKNIEDLDIPTAVIVTDLLDGQAYRLTKGNLAQALRASSSLPPAIRPIEMDGHLYADGGLRANVPTIPARAMGAKVVIAVETDAHIRKIDEKQLKSLPGLLDRVASIGLSIMDEYHKLKADLVIDPKIDSISVYSFSKENAQLAIKAGEAAARAALPDICKLVETNKAKVAVR